MVRLAKGNEKPRSAESEHPTDGSSVGSESVKTIKRKLSVGNVANAPGASATNGSTTSFMGVSRWKLWTVEEEQVLTTLILSEVKVSKSGRGTIDWSPVVNRYNNQYPTRTRTRKGLENRWWQLQKQLSDRAETCSNQDLFDRLKGVIAMLKEKVVVKEVEVEGNDGESNEGLDISESHSE
uniref:Myb-like domain-containing protein n=1 Tax=Steinernema glaseri TaxID=37863 RepID=A0A1I7ZB41_9BILA